MKAVFYVFVVLLAALSLAPISSVHAQASTKMTPEEILAAIKPGIGVKLEGVIQRDYSVLCMKAKILTGDFRDDDWSITAVAGSIDKAQQEFKLLRLPVKTRSTTDYETKIGVFKSFDDLKAGTLVEVDGTYLKGDTLLALEIEDVSAELVAEPGSENEVEIKGKVEKVDVPNRTVTLMGITFHINDNTRLKSASK